MTWTSSLRHIPHCNKTAGFTLVEVLVAGVITAMVMGSVALSLGQLGRAKLICSRNISRVRTVRRNTRC